MTKWGKAVLAAVLVLGMATPAMAAEEETSWAAKAQHRGLMFGDTNGNFHELDSLTRREAAVIVANLLHAIPLTMKTKPSFSDVKMGDWGYGAIEALADAEILRGDEQGRFHPDRPITRQEMAVLLVKATGIGTDGETADFADEGLIAVWAQSFAHRAAGLGLIDPAGEHFKPHNPVIRRDAAKMIVKTMDFYAAQQSQKAGVWQTITTQTRAIRDKNLQAYLGTLDPANQEFIAERKNWFLDLTANADLIRDFDLKPIDVFSLDDETVLVKFEQSYTMNGEPYQITYQERFIKTETGMLDSDLNFETLETEHYTINYLRHDREVAEKIAVDAELAYDQLMEQLEDKRLGKKTKIKLYDDLELLRQSVKLSFGWRFSGWYEYAESIKANSLRGTAANYSIVIGHETTHEITIAIANNNLPYWYAEGLAVHYSGQQTVPWDGTLLSLPELEAKNLETMTAGVDVQQYYTVSGMVVRFLSETYGADKVKALTAELGTFPFGAGTIADRDAENKQKFHTAAQKVLGVSMKELNTAWLAWLKALE